MVRRAFASKPDENGGTKSRRSRRDILSIREVLDELSIARCPLCRGMLIARMSRGGPAFFCACPPRAKKLAA
jgi:hypothetical protein